MGEDVGVVESQIFGDECYREYSFYILQQDYSFNFVNGFMSENVSIV